MFYAIHIENSRLDLNDVFSDEARFANQKLNQTLNSLGAFTHIPDITNGCWCCLYNIETRKEVNALIRFAKERERDTNADGKLGEYFGVSIFKMVEVK